LTFDQILIRKRSKMKDDLYFTAQAFSGFFLFSSQGALRYLSAAGRDSRVSLHMHDFVRTDWRIVTPEFVKAKEKTDG
jgi:hypothetical protein